MARSFNGSSDFIQAGAAITTVPGTICAWFNPTSGTFGTDVFSLADTGGVNNELRLLGDGSGHLLAAVKDSGGNQTTQAGTTTLSANTWFHGSVTSTTANLSIFTNGGNKQTAAIGTFVSQAINDVGIGALVRGGGNVSFFGGSVADCAVWNVILTDAEIAALAKGARPYAIRPTALKGYWPLDGLQSPEPDVSGNKLNGTLTGTALAFGAPTMMLTPRWPLIFPNTAAAAASFQAAWAMRNRIVVEGIGI